MEVIDNYCQWSINKNKQSHSKDSAEKKNQVGSVNFREKAAEKVRKGKKTSHRLGEQGTMGKRGPQF